MAGKRRFRGPAGAVFVPAETVTEQMIARYVELGEWTPVEPVVDEPADKPSVKARPVKRSPRKSN